MKKIILAGGCFWGLQDLIRRQPGVVGTRVGYTGGVWQPSGIEFAMLWKLGRQASGTAGPWVALGSFTQNNAVYLGRSQGFFAALGATVRQPVVTLAEIGSERHPGYVRVEVDADVGWSADFNSPLVQGRSDVRAGLLVGISFGSAEALGQSFSLLYGPAALIGAVTTTHGQIAMRFRMPVR